MKCHKCGYEYNGSGACPSCGTNAIVVSEDYLRRKREYEESGKISIGNVEFRSSEDANDMVEGEDIEEEDILITAYRKMKNRATASMGKKSPKKKEPKKATQKSKTDSPKKIKVDKAVVKKATIIAVAALFVVGLISLLVYLLSKPKDMIYVVSADAPVKEKNVVTCVINDKEAYLYKDEEKHTISENTITNITYTKDFSLFVFEEEGELYIYSSDDGKKSLGLKATDISGKYLESSGKYVAFTEYKDEVYTLYRYNSKGEVETISTGANSKNVIYVDSQGNVVYTDIEYSPINGINSVSLMAYIDGKKVTITEAYVNAAVFEHSGELLVLDGDNTCYSVKLNKDLKKKNVMTDVENMYLQTTPGTYTLYGNKIVTKEMDAGAVIKSGDKFYYADGGKNFATTYLFEEKSSSIHIIANEIKSRVNYVKENELFDKKGSVAKLGGEGAYAYNQERNELIYVDDNKQLVKDTAKGSQVLIKGVDATSLSLTADGENYIYFNEGEQTTFVCAFGKEKMIKVTDMMCKAVMVHKNRIYYVNNENKLVIANKKGKVQAEYENVSEIWGKSVDR